MNQSNEIRESITLIQQMINTEKFIQLFAEDQSKYKYELSQLFPTFSSEYPILFKKVILKQDLVMLEQMLKSIEDLNNGKDEKNVTTSIGESLAEKYLYPVLGKPETKNEKNPEFITK